MVELSEDQLYVKNGVYEQFVCNKQKVVKMVGYAGTGKTTLIKEIINKLKEQQPRLKFAYCTYTGKASTVLKSKLSELFVEDYDYCGTIHSLMYIPIIEKDINGKNKIVGWNKIIKLDFDYIIIDEASMVPPDIYEDLKDYQIPMLLVGDHGQLPPVNGNSTILLDYDFELTQIHRQCENNPIIQLSDYVRKMGILPNLHVWSQEVFKLPWKHDKCQEIFNNINLTSDLIILCNFNKTRVAINNMIRKKLNYVLEEPYLGERVICLKNNRSSGIMNGQTGMILSSIPVSKNVSNMTILMDGIETPFQGNVDILAFGKETYNQDDYYDEKTFKTLRKNKNKFKHEPRPDVFEFGYCISVYKSQGSEWDNVVLFEQKSKYMSDEDYAKWLYTGITRAKKKLFIIGEAWL